MYTYIYIHPPAPMNNVIFLRAGPPETGTTVVQNNAMCVCAPSKLVQLWYKTVPPDQRGFVEIKNPTRLSN